MKNTEVVAMAILATNLAPGQVVQTGSKLTVCLVDDGHTVARNQSTSIASKIYSVIGVTLDWQSGARFCNSAGVIHVELTDDTPVSLMPGALAYALPYEGIHVRVFFDRIEKAAGARTMPYLLAHVLAHEIGHILQGINRHSETGVMKAHWTQEDNSRMILNGLSFTAEDVTLIRRGLEGRTARLSTTGTSNNVSASGNVLTLGN